ncbi:MAG: RimK family alpha-L-glutamate ligase [Lachnospirales bacterium]
MNEVLKKAIYEICEEENIELLTFSREWIFRLEKNNIVRYISGFKFPNNDLAAADICNDKIALYEVLNKKGFQAIEHFSVFLNEYSELNDEYFEKYLKLYGKVLVKDNRGSCGKNIYLCDNVSSIRENLEKLFLTEYLVAISPFVNIEAEYRVILLDGELQIIYGKKVKSVTGDGISDIFTLCEMLDIKTTYLREDFLKNVPYKGENVPLDFQHNLSRYGEYFNIVDIELKEMLCNLAKDVARAINISFASIDIVKVENEFYVLEVNAGVMAETFGKGENFTLVKNMYKKAILSSFNK